MGIKSRNRGKYYEREAVHFWRTLGYEGARRSQQYAGGVDSADITGGPASFHIEVKGGQNLPDVYGAIDQVRRDAGPMKIPLCMLKRKNREWVFVIPYEHIDFVTRCVEHYVKEQRPQGHAS